MTTLIGTLNVGGLPVNGTLWLEISQQALAAGGVNVSPSAPAVFQLTAGAISGPGAGPYTVYGNDVLSPPGTFYRLTVFGSSGEQLLRGNVYIAGATQDIGAFAQASTQQWIVPIGYSVLLIGDANGLSTDNTVTGIHKKPMAAPPWTPGHIVTVQADQSLAPSALVVIPGASVVSETAFGQSPTAGGAPEYSRRDHSHGTPAEPTPGSIGAAPASHSHPTGVADGVLLMSAGGAVAASRISQDAGLPNSFNLRTSETAPDVYRGLRVNEEAGAIGIVPSDTDGVAYILMPLLLRGKNTGTEILLYPGEVRITGPLYNDGEVVWNAANGGAGSGMDADLLDGQEALDLRRIPQNPQTGAYVLAASDIGNHVSTTTGGVTVPSGIFAAGDPISIYNASGAGQTITQGTSVTLRLAGTATTGNRTLAQRGLCTLLCVGPNEFVISGQGLS